MSGSEVVIVGGGVTGLSAGWWLARSGVKVTVLDKFIVGWEASGRNGGGASHYASPLFDEEQRLWPQMDELLGYPTEHQKGRILIAMTERQWEQYRFIAERHKRLNHPVELLDVKQVQEAVPLAGDNCFGGVHYKFGGHANPQRSVQAYAWALQDLGGKIIQHSPVTGFETAGGKVTAVKTANATYGCDSVVVAAGPQIPQLMAQLGVNVPLAAARAEMIITEPAPMMPLGGVDGHKIYGRQTMRGNLAYGGGPHEWLDMDATGPAARPSTPLARNLAKRLAELLPKAAHLNVIRSWAGVIENSPDGRPIIDRLTSPDNVVVASMSSVGFGLSPASGHAIRDLVIDGKCSFADIDILKLSRFDNLESDWREKRGWMAIT
ncbi:FAD-binding oxidoreductase [Sphingorhabdus sp.]|jgi:sarcosine oxidase subunit beta|uniref:NAD(P)/FAD-dependent oxidoreductase n=1 Tax=Sphingorhabdus sp. TaxID=1902408 RepID=UPI00273FCFEC|nr:FAD-binding oxidoreductase [Sphingorhabdus sp.]MDP4758040.1 FAD-binding oxidoreductase [Sphingorhabdus sp.]MDP4927415.1 FAD-binding oxidoreductase [Sphingorhabdus sp.]